MFVPSSHLAPAVRRGWILLAPLLALTAAVEVIAAAAIYRLAAGLAALDLPPRQIAALAAVFLVRALLVWATAALQSRVTTESIAMTVDRLLAGCLAEPYRTRANPAQHIQRMTAATDTTYRLVAASIAGLVSELLVMIALSALLITIVPAAASVTAALMVAAGTLLLMLVRRSVARYGAIQYEAGQQTLAELQEIFSGMREIRTAQREREFHARTMATQRRAAAAMRRHLVAVTMPRVVLELAFAAAALAIASVLSGTRSIPVLAVLAYVAFRLIPSGHRLVYHLDHIRHGSRAVREVADALREAEPWALPERRPREETFRDALVLDGVSYAYPDSERVVLANATLSVRKGEWIGICGDNGSGKSTLLDVIAGLLRPDHGSVTIDGRALGEWLSASPPVIRLLSQRPHLFIEEEPQRSGGERQRSVLQAILASSAEILLLDEPATALDADAQRSMLEALQATRGRATVILVSHDEEMLARCDRIVTLRSGRLYERASSSATMARI